MQLNIAKGDLERLTSWNPRTVLEENSRTREIDHVEWEDENLGKNFVMLYYKTLMHSTRRDDGRWNSQDLLWITIRTICEYDEIKSWTPENAKLKVVVEYSGNHYFQTLGP